MRRGRAAITGERNAFAQQKAPAGGAGAFSGRFAVFRPSGGGSGVVHHAADALGHLVAEQGAAAVVAVLAAGGVAAHNAGVVQGVHVAVGGVGGADDAGVDPAGGAHAQGLGGQLGHLQTGDIAAQVDGGVGDDAVIHRVGQVAGGPVGAGALHLSGVAGAQQNHRQRLAPCHSLLGTVGGGGDAGDRAGGGQAVDEGVGPGLGAGGGHVGEDRGGRGGGDADAHGAADDAARRAVGGEGNGHGAAVAGHGHVGHGADAGVAGDGGHVGEHVAGRHAGVAGGVPGLGQGAAAGRAEADGVGAEEGVVGVDE